MWNLECPALQAVFDSIKVTVKNLPKNMTDVLQVMDLVANAPLQAGIRRVRCDQLFDHLYFHSWKLKRVKEAAKPADVSKLPPHGRHPSFQLLMASEP